MAKTAPLNWGFKHDASLKQCAQELVELALASPPLQTKVELVVAPQRCSNQDALAVVELVRETLPAPSQCWAEYVYCATCEEGKRCETNDCARMRLRLSRFQVLTENGQMRRDAVMQHGTDERLEMVRARRDVLFGWMAVAFMLGLLITLVLVFFLDMAVPIGPDIATSAMRNILGMLAFIGPCGALMMLVGRHFPTVDALADAETDDGKAWARRILADHKAKAL